jgi:hypothetical protein
MSQIFYSPVAEELKAELDARARAGSSSRNNKDLNFMLGKMASIKAMPYEIATSLTADIKEQTPIVFGELGGETVRRGRFLPDGFLNDQTIKREIYSLNLEPAADDTYGGQTAKVTNTGAGNFINKSKRVSTYIESAEISYGDHSMGLLNTATMNIRIPNPGADLEFIESVWFRPGRRAVITIESPKSSIITDTLTLTYSGSQEQTKQTMNSVQFDGILVSFDFSYNADTSVSATLSFRGTSHIITDLALIKAKVETVQEQENTTGEGEVKKSETTTFYQSVERQINKQLALNAFAGIKYYIETSKLRNNQDDLFITTIKELKDTDKTSGIDYEELERIYDRANYNNGTIFVTELATATDGTLDPYVNTTQQKQLYREYIKNLAFIKTDDLKDLKLAQFSGSAQVPEVLRFQHNQFNSNESEKPNSFIDIVFSSPLTNNRASAKTWLTLDYAIFFINSWILQTGGKNFIDVRNLESKFYPELVSTMPDHVILNGNHYQLNPSKYEDEAIKKYNTQTSSSIDFDTAPKLNTFNVAVGDGTETYTLNHIFYNDYSYIIQGSGGRTRGIYISLEQFKAICTSAESKKLNINAIITGLSGLINQATAGVVNLQLISNKDNTNQLQLVDANYTPITPEVKNHTQYAYQMPMLANSVAQGFGSVVRDFKFTAKLPTSAQNLAYVTNQPDAVTESQIAPFLSFMYQRTNLERSIDATGAIIETNKESVEEIAKQLKTTAETKYREYLIDLQVAKLKFAKDPTSSTNLQNLNSAMIRHVQYPTPNIRDSMNLATPIIPFDVTVTIDGINGFRYGDVLDFPALPSRYRKDVVFSVINVNHTISNDGDWTTTLRCIMRPKIT